MSFKIRRVAFAGGISSAAYKHRSCKNISFGDELHNFGSSGPPVQKKNKKTQKKRENLQPFFHLRKASMMLFRNFIGITFNCVTSTQGRGGDTLRECRKKLKNFRESCLLFTNNVRIKSCSN